MSKICTKHHREGSLILYPALGHSLNEAWILQVLFLRPQGIRGTYWSARITSPNGQKLNHWLIRDVDAKRFMWKNIVTRFGVPYTLISDNGLQFDNKAFQRYCCDLRITNRYSTPAYLQGNEQVEAVNKVIVNGLKKRLDDAKGKQVEELSHILQTYRSMPRRLTGETPFSMTYGVEAIVFLEIEFPTLRRSSFTPSNNNELLRKSLDLIEE